VVKVSCCAIVTHVSCCCYIVSYIVVTSCLMLLLHHVLCYVTTGQKLHVINMNQQSDMTDLLGG